MGCQGIVRKKSIVDQIARYFGVPWKAITVYCHRDNGSYWVCFGARRDPWFPPGKRVRISRCWTPIERKDPR